MTTTIPTVTLTSYNLGDQADEAFFDALWEDGCADNFGQPTTVAQEVR